MQTPIQPSKDSFIYGSCASNAISAAFDVSSKAVTALILAFGEEEYEEGADFFICKRVINTLAKVDKINVRYVTNKSKINYYQFVNLFLKGKFLLNFPEHLSFCEDGVIFDNHYRCGNLEEDITELKKCIPTGWWEISKRKSYSEWVRYTSMYA